MAEELATRLTLAAQAALARGLTHAGVLETRLLELAARQAPGVPGVSVLRLLISAAVVLAAGRLALGLLSLLAALLLPPRAVRVSVPLTEEEARVGSGQKWDASAPLPKDFIPCYDPGNMELLGSGRAVVDSPAAVAEKVAKAAAAQKQWASSSFAQRRLLLRTIQRFILDNQTTICEVAARDSGKPLVDAAFGEVMVTLEKIAWLCAEGEAWLRPEARSCGLMMFYKRCRVEYVPFGVMGAVVPWNYPFHNVFNPLLSNLFAGNALVVKVSEHASWSAGYYGRAIRACLAAAGAPPDLVQIVTGYADSGRALVTHPDVSKVVFVGSVPVGRKVGEDCARALKPCVMELGGKDAFIVLSDADLGQVVPIALRGAFQSCGQNCAGAERFFVHRSLYAPFLARCAAATSAMRVGWALGGPDAGAMCMPGQAGYVAGLVADAVARGARVVATAQPPAGDGGARGQFSLPTVLADVSGSMRISREEVFGPVLCVTPFDSDDEAVRLANDCAFGLGSSVFGRDVRRAEALAARLQAGMSSINDFATTYMAQSLPFGGVKESGYDRFAGVEGLRGCCVPKAVAVDRWPWLMRTDIPPPLQYPVAPYAFEFVAGLIKMFYGLSLLDRARGVGSVIACFVLPSKKKAKVE